MVFAFHSLRVGQNRLDIQNDYIGNLLLAYMNGKTGVSIFFVLSGFLITYLILSEINATGKLNLGNFYLRRILRIWPLYFIVLIIVFFILPAIVSVAGVDYNANDTRAVWYFTFLSNFDVLRIFAQGGKDFLPSTITWSVAIEEQFYLFWPLLFYFIPPAGYKYVFITILIGAFFFRLVNYNRIEQVAFHTISAMFDLCAGGIAAWLAATSTRFRNFFAAMPDSKRLIILTAGLVLLYVNVFAGSMRLRGILTSVQVFFFAWVVLDQCFSNSSRFKFSNSRWLTRMGKYTYGIYMLHPLVLLFINTLLIRVFHMNMNDVYSELIVFIAGLPLTLWLAKLSYRLVEKRFLLLKEKFSFAQVPA